MRRWFVVRERNGRLEPAVYADYLPSELTGKRAKDLGVRYVLPLDEAKEHMTPAQLMHLYRARGALPGAT